MSDEKSDTSRRPSARGARMADVAEIAGVSPMTVSRALNNPKLVTPETLKRIRSAIKVVGYLPNRVAGNLSSRRSNIVGLVVPSLRNSLFSETIQGVADILGQDFDLMIANSGYSLRQEEAAITAFLSQRVCGIILHNTKHTPRSRRLLLEAKIPCVETGNLSTDPIDVSVGFSNFAAAKAMTDRLVGRGHRRIGFISLFLKDNDRAAERKNGYLASLAEHGLELDPRIVREVAPGLASGAGALRELLQDGPGPDAIFATGDVLATGALLEAIRLGMKVPEDMAIVGSDDNEIQERLTPSLTSLRFPRYEIGRTAANLLIDRVAGRASGPASVDLGFRIMERQSG